MIITMISPVPHIPVDIILGCGVGVPVLSHELKKDGLLTKFTWTAVRISLQCQTFRTGTCKPSGSCCAQQT